MTPKSNRKPFKKTLKKKVEKLEKWGRRGVLDLGWHGDGKSELG